MSKVFLFRSFLGLAMALSVSSSLAFAQAGAGGAGAGSTGGGAAGGSTGGGNTGGGTTTPGRGNPDPNSNSRIPQNNPSSQMPDMPRPIYLSGKVQMDDGSAPPSQVVIERVCNGVARPEGYTSSKGHFSFALGQNTAVLADASVGRMGESPMGGRMSGGG